MIVGDCVEEMAKLAPCSVDAIVTDPPYGLEFMGKEWDRLGGAAGRAMQEWHYRWAVEALRVLKPGGHLLAFGGTRTYHRLACAVEDAGFEIRDTICWLYGTGFPKSRDVSKAIDDAAGAERTEVVGVKPGHEEFIDRTDAHSAGGRSDGWDRPWRDDPEAVARSHTQLAPATEDARRWQGWGTALKPAHEPIVVARKPLVGTVAANVLAHGTGALNIDGCRVEHASEADLSLSLSKNPGRDDLMTSDVYGAGRPQQSVNTEGRWPANVALAHTEECVLVGTRRVRGGTAGEKSGGIGAGRVYGAPGLRAYVDLGGGYVGEDGYETTEAWECAEGCPVAALDAQSGERVPGNHPARRSARDADKVYGTGWSSGTEGERRPTEAGGASRFFYTAKASRAERDAGLAGFERRPLNWSSGDESPGTFQSDGTDKTARNAHPTVKPIDLMRWLLRLVTPAGGSVLDPFAGSGTTGCAAALERLQFFGIERDPDYAAIADARIAFWAEHGERGLELVRGREALARRRADAEAAGQMALEVE